MKNKIIFSMILVVLILWFLSIKPKNNNVEIEGLRVNYDKYMLVNHSSNVILGKIISKKEGLDNELPYVDLIVKVNENFKGNSKEVINIRTYASNSIRKDDCSDELDVKINEELVLFLSDEKGDHNYKDEFDYFLLGVNQGVFRVVDDKIKNNDGTEFNYDTFKSEIIKTDENFINTGDEI